MTNIVREVSDLKDDERRAFERVLGLELRDHQHIVIGIQPDARSTADCENSSAPMESIPEWWNVFEGLSDSDVDQLDAAIRQRANLSRGVE